MSSSITLHTAQDTLEFDARTGQLLSFRSHYALDHEFLASSPDQPAFVLGYLDETGQYRQLDSRQAAGIMVQSEPFNEGVQLKARYSALGGLALEITTTVWASTAERFTHWGLTLDNQAGIRVVNLQFPFLVVHPMPDGATGSEAILYAHGEYPIITDMNAPEIAWEQEDTWHLAPSTGDVEHYPGHIIAQFIAYYNDRAGLYLACHDTEGNIKRIKPVRHADGIRLGIAHIGDWPECGQRTLEYEVVLGSFTGDWYDVADLYRDWALQQKWARPLYRRTDVPAWLLDSPPFFTMRMQGELDEGPIFPVEAFLPYRKALPLLEELARRLDAPLAILLMCWERGGAWVYPDCFPPIGGDAAMKEFVDLCRARGWHVGSFCNGSRWVVAHTCNQYDGRAYFHTHQGEQSVCRTADGHLWQETWDAEWRPSYACCMGTPMTREIAKAFVSHLASWGMEAIQFFDQNVSGATFPCYAVDHEHPPVPGKWMADKMWEMVRGFQEATAEYGLEAVQSVEQSSNEYYLPLFPLSDVRPWVPCYQNNYLPLPHYLYHECCIMQAHMAMAPSPYSIPMRTAYSGVIGEIPGAVMTGDGTLLNKDTWNWARWEPKVGNNDDALEMIRNVTRIRRGPGKDFLVYGRMQRPALVEDIRNFVWEYDDVELRNAKFACWHYEDNQRRSAAVFHAAWQAPDGRFAIVLANWTTESQTVHVTDVRLGKHAFLHTAGTILCTEVITVSAAMPVTLPPLSMVVIEQNNSAVPGTPSA